MNRPLTILATDTLALLLIAGALAQAGSGIVFAETAPAASGVVHHFDNRPATWDPRLTDADRDLQLIVGEDERTRVFPTTVSPHRSIAYLEAWDDEQEIGYSCTATFIGPRTLLTAAHCIWVDEFGGWPDRVIIAPGKDGDANPFGFELASSLWVPNGWASTTGNSVQRFQWDFGLINLPSDAIGNMVGALEIGIFSDATLEGDNFNPVTSGYPGDKTRGTQWASTAPAFDRVNANHLINSIDAFQGQSGSPFWGANDGRIVGIISFETRTTNYALRINQRVVDGLLDGCVLLSCQFTYSYDSDDPQLTPGTGVVPTPPVPDGNEFYRTWERTDRPVADGSVSRTWMWGPDGTSITLMEPYLESPGGERTVTYFDKSRMEITNPHGDPGSIWYVTNGLLVMEMITGNVQVGNNSFEQHAPANINIAGDPDDPNGPTYASFASVQNAPSQAEGQPVTHWIARDGTVTNDPSLAARGVTSARFVPETNHTVASVFWGFMNLNDLVYESGNLTVGPLFQNPFYATGLPVSEAYWTTVRIGGIEQDILIQAFERRVLTYTPGNSPGWEVEAGNVGRHYYQWRYEEIAGD